VWECNPPAVAAFRLCSIGCVATFGGLFWTGIDAPAIRASLALVRIPRDEWPDVSIDVRYMGAVVADERNRRAEIAARRKR